MAFCKKYLQNTKVLLNSESSQASPSTLPSNQALLHIEWYKGFPAQHMGCKNLQKIFMPFQISSQFPEEWDIWGKVYCQISSKIESQAFEYEPTKNYRDQLLLPKTNKQIKYPNKTTTI